MELKGITITLREMSEGERDAFNMPRKVYTDTNVADVLVGEPSTEDITQTFNLYGKKVKYTLAIPKGDTHNWVNALVVLPEPFGGEYKTIGYPTAGIEENIPLRWNKKVHIERVGEYESENSP
ncbi:MAG: hypothetical protein IJS61_03525 [Firmicutes bacterium]|nr:hypothetical protein [Bacillota bacterium]